MLCRFGVKSREKGGELAFDPTQYNLLSVFDTQKDEYRFINLDTLMFVTIQGKTYEISEEEK